MNNQICLGAIWEHLWGKCGENSPTKKPYPIENQIGLALKSTQSRGRTGTGITPLVFETSASTNSAIWALAVAKVKYFFGLAK